MTTTLKKSFHLSKRKKILLAVLALVFIWWLFCLPHPLFDKPLSNVLEDRNGQLLGAHIAADGQWRFPAPDSLPYKLGQAIIRFEDKRFYHHPGVDIWAIGRAVRQNLRAGQIVSGGSTITMQVMRLAADNPPRNLWHKLKEAFQALRLEWRYDKDQILLFWASNAPFGGNVVGVEAAAWRYFGKKLDQLSWAEAATLAVLPNSPALIHPGRNRSALLAKRNRLLQSLYEAGEIDEMGWQLASAEQLPPAPYPLPQLAPHLLQRSEREHGAGRHKTSLNAELQANLNKLIQRQQKSLSANRIHNLTALVVEVETGQTLAYVANVPGLEEKHSPSVDLITSSRSPGSLLKPLLYSLAVDEGSLLPQAWIPDVPRQFLGFRPENFYRKYEGLIPADQALSRSLNVPFVDLLQHYGVSRFHKALNEWGFSTIQKPAEHYGLSLILGGCEVNLWEAVGWYASMGRMLRNYPKLQSRYAPNNWQSPSYLIQEQSKTKDFKPLKNPDMISAAAAWFTLEALLEVNRPDEEGEWKRFGSSRRVAWKTGTSHGFRDAWAVGITGKYVVGVWAGNADGEGRPELVGLKAAAPTLFRILKELPPDQEWYPCPFDDLRPTLVCTESGHPASLICPTDTLDLARKAKEGQPCPYHQEILTDPSGQYRLTANCAPVEDMQRQLYLKLSPLESYFFRPIPLPDWHPDCQPNQQQANPMQLIYPRSARRIKVPRNLDGSLSATIFSLAHRDNSATIYWHLDEYYLGSTQDYRSMELRPTPGEHQLVLVDDQGNRLEQIFEIVE